MEHRYIATYAFELREGHYDRETDKAGWGQMHITTDHEPTTQEDFNEIAKQIFRSSDHAYKQISVIKVVEPKDEDPLQLESEEILEGEIIE